MSRRSTTAIVDPVAEAWAKRGRCSRSSPRASELTNFERWEHFLDVQSRLHHYSFLNTLATLVQRADASRVAGFHAWRRLGPTGPEG